MKMKCIKTIEPKIAKNMTIEFSILDVNKSWHLIPKTKAITTKKGRKTYNRKEKHKKPLWQELNSKNKLKNS